MLCLFLKNNHSINRRVYQTLFLFPSSNIDNQATTAIQKIHASGINSRSNKKGLNFIQCTHKRITELLDTTTTTTTDNNNNNNTLYFYSGCHGIVEVSNKLVALYLKLY